MKLTEHFSMEEMTASNTAKARHIDNTPGEKETENLKALASMLESIRKEYGKPITVTSAFRCKRLNSLVSSAKTSSHIYGLAADTRPADGNMAAYQAAVLRWAKSNSFDQIILERVSGNIAAWIHIGLRHGVTGQQRQQILYTPDCKHYYVVPQNSKFYKV